MQAYFQFDCLSRSAENEKKEFSREESSTTNHKRRKKIGEEREISIKLSWKSQRRERRERET